MSSTATVAPVAPVATACILGGGVATVEERLAAAQAKIAKATADKEAAMAATAAAKEAAAAAKAAAKAAREAEKASKPKRPVGRPRKHTTTLVIPTPPAEDASSDTDSITASIEESVGSDTVCSLRAELADLRSQLAIIQAAYEREHAILESARKLFS